ncbi:MAG: hypothetical protein QHH01_07210 [Spirochaetales bacterium]|nr:hypothetical protein [Spirochaetales bacterium]
MLILALVEDDTAAAALHTQTQHIGVHLIRMRDPVRLIDSIEELMPDVVIVDCHDFPLHARVLDGMLACRSWEQSTSLVMITDTPMQQSPAEGVVFTRDALTAASQPFQRWLCERFCIRDGLQSSSQPAGETARSGSRLVARAEQALLHASRQRSGSN